jgi:hypothetical protein
MAMKKHHWVGFTAIQSAEHPTGEPSMDADLILTETAKPDCCLVPQTPVGTPPVGALLRSQAGHPLAQTGRLQWSLL